MQEKKSKKKRKKKSKSFFRKLLRLSSFVFFVIFAFSIFIIIYFSAHKNEFAEKILLSLNEKSSGEVVFQDIALYPFIQFPNISLALEGIEFYENHESIRDSIEKPICRFKTVYAAVNIVDLISNEISVSSFILEDGEINIIKYPNKSFNFLNALKINKKEVVKKKPLTEKSNDKKPVKKKKVTPKKKPTKKKPLISKKLKLSLDKISPLVVLPTIFILGIRVTRVSINFCINSTSHMPVNICNKIFSLFGKLFLLMKFFNSILSVYFRLIVFIIFKSPLFRKVNYYI